MLNQNKPRVKKNKNTDMCIFYVVSAILNLQFSTAQQFRIQIPTLHKG